jgi:S-adenosylmethionine hydrolase
MRDARCGIRDENDGYWILDIFVLMKRIQLCLLFAPLLVSFCSLGQSKALVFQSDFGLKDGAVSAMKGVAYGVSPEIDMFDLTHEIPAYDIWEAAYRLYQTAPYWPKGTVFVSVVDPGVGSDRKSVVMKTNSGHYFVTPDNGTLTLVAELLGVAEVRIIDESVNRLKNSDSSYTFHGRDVYAYTGARLASGMISFEKVGSKTLKDVTRIRYQKAIFENEIVKGNIPVLDVQYGNVWTNIDRKTLAKLSAKIGDKLSITIFNENKQIFNGVVKLSNTFADVAVGENLGYMNSLGNFAVGVNQASFSEKYKVYSGSAWTIHVKKLN